MSASTVVIASRFGPRTVKGFPVGEHLLVHENIDGPGWNVSHKSGAAMVRRFESGDEAKEFAETLLGKFPEFFDAASALPFRAVGTVTPRIRGKAAVGRFCKARADKLSEQSA